MLLQVPCYSVTCRHCDQLNILIHISWTNMCISTEHIDTYQLQNVYISAEDTDIYQLNKQVHINWTYWYISAEQISTYQYVCKASQTHFRLLHEITPVFLKTKTVESSIFMSLQSLLTSALKCLYVTNLCSKAPVSDWAGVWKVAEVHKLSQVRFCRHYHFEDWEAISYNLVRVCRSFDTIRSQSSGIFRVI
jgi:hypothetical protein